MTETIEIQGSNDGTIATLEVPDDAYRAMQLEAALIGVPVRVHVIETIAGHAQEAADEIEESA